MTTPQSPRPDARNALEKACLTCKVVKALDSFAVSRENGGKRIRRCEHCQDCQRARWRSPEYKTKLAARYARAREAGQKSEQDRAHAAKRRELYPEKERAKRAVRSAIVKGILIRPDSCEVCHKVPPPIRGGKTGIHGHHDDYSKPLDVRWLCVACHAAHHSQEKAA